MNTLLVQNNTTRQSSISLDEMASSFKQHVAMIPIKNYQDFYRFYLSEHRNINCRRLHFLGSSIALQQCAQALWTGRKRHIVYAIFAGYTCAWIGHFGFEKNRPASLKQPYFSFISDWRMYGHIWTRKISLIDRCRDSF